MELRRSVQHYLIFGWALLSAVATLLVFSAVWAQANSNQARVSVNAKHVGA